MINLLAQRGRTGIALLLVVVVWMAGCTTPAAVREFTEVARDAVALIPPIIGDLNASCIRKQLAERPVNEIEDVSQQTTAACKEFADLQDPLLGALNVLTNYLNALHQLASDGLVSYDKQIDGFAAAVQGAGKFGDAPVKAVKGLAKFLFDAAASGYQRKKLGAALKAADADVATLTTALGGIIAQDYDRLLRVEEDTLRTRYREAILADKNPSSVTQLLIQERWRQDLLILSGKRRAARDYQIILGKIRDGHHELAAQVDHWSAKELYQTLGPYAASIRALIGDFKTAF